MRVTSCLGERLNKSMYLQRRKFDLMFLGSQYKRIIDKAILNLHSGGTMKMLKEKWFKNTNSKCTEQASSSRLEMGQIGGVFVCLAVGIAVGFLALLCELMRFWH